MPEQDPIPPRRTARRYAPGEDDDVPPWASLPPVRPRREPGQRRDPRPGQGPGQAAPRPGHHRGHDHGPGPAPGQPAPGPHVERCPNCGATLELEAGNRCRWCHVAVQMAPVQPPPGPPEYRYAPEEEYPAEAGDEDEQSEQTGRRQSRVARALARKRRRTMILAVAALVAIGAVVGVVFLAQGAPQSAVNSGDLITTFQPGELQTVPNACTSIPSVTIQEYMPGKVKTAAPLPINGKLGSGCNWTVDHQPLYRLLEVQILAYAPNGLASGDGSATNAAIDAYAAATKNIEDPAKGLAADAAPVTQLSQVGNEAFQALQVFKAGGATTDVATVVIRFHNVLVTVEFNGLARSNKGHYGPVDTTQLEQAAVAFAQSAYAALR